ncbi:hypothetical protein [Yersinia ruckeri]
MQKISFTQRLDKFSKKKPTPYAFIDWQHRLSRNDKLPRGKYFKGKLGGEPLFVIDELHHIFLEKKEEMASFLEFSSLKP